MPRDPYRGPVPTRPRQPAQKADPRAEPGADEGEPTQQRCTLCLGHGYIPPEHAIAFEAFCAKLHAEQEE